MNELCVTVIPKQLKRYFSLRYLRPLCSSRFMKKTATAQIMKHLSVSRCREQRWRWEWTRGGKKGKRQGCRQVVLLISSDGSTFGQLPGNGVLDNSWGWVDVALLSQQAVAGSQCQTLPPILTRSVRGRSSFTRGGSEVVSKVGAKNWLIKPTRRGRAHS